MFKLPPLFQLDVILKATKATFSSIKFNFQDVVGTL